MRIQADLDPDTDLDPQHFLHYNNDQFLDTQYCTPRAGCWSTPQPASALRNHLLGTEQSLFYEHLNIYPTHILWSLCFKSALVLCVLIIG